MMDMNRKTNRVDAYNDEVANWHYQSITMGSLKSPRNTLGQLVRGHRGFDHDHDNRKKR